ncbi:MAG: CoA transferase [Actinomycetia bacterium]|nr:CoA transferase [Actinomycetes bacterium]
MLSEYRVLDLTDERGHLAGFILAQMGAEVVAIEPPGGSSARRMGPFAHDIDDGEHSLHHWAYNRGKKSVVIDLETSEGRDEVLSLVDGADILIDSFDPGVMAALGLDPATLATRNPSLIHAAITAYGSDGPKANWAYADVTIQASAGNMVITGDKDRAPLRAGGLMPQAFHNAASEAAAAILIALHERQTVSGLGQFVDMSAQQSMNQAAQSMMMAAPNNAVSTTRIAGGANLQGIDIQLMWPCADGHASVTLLFGAGFAPFTRNLMAWVHDEGFIDEATRDKDWADYALMLLDGREPVAEYTRVKDCLTAFFATKTKAELLDAAMTRRVLITPVWTTDEVLNCEQLSVRGYWEDVDHGEFGTVRYPGPFAKFSASPLAHLTAPPTLGAHTDEVLRSGTRTPQVAVSDTKASTDRPLEGVKILDLMWVMAGPAGSRVLADYGADIIRVESVNKADVARTLQPFRDDVTDPDLSGLFQNMNAGKRGLSLDMSKPGALDVIWDLIDWADVILDSFSPKAMKGWGLDYASVVKRKPDIIMVSSCLMGHTGPLAMLAGFGTMAAAISGFFYPVGWPDRAPAGPFGAYTDYTSPRWLVASIMGAVEHHRATGEGQVVDMSQAEAALHLIAPAMLDQSVNGRTLERIGNRDRVFVPNGVFPTGGDDQWMAVAARHDDDWQTIANSMGRADLAAFDLAARHEAIDEIEAAVTAWTSTRDGAELMGELQAAGVPAHIVANSPEFMADPQIQHREHFAEVSHCKGEYVVEASRFHLSRTPATYGHGGPTFGEHTFDTLTEVLGYDGDRIAELAVAELLE